MDSSVYFLLIVVICLLQRLMYRLLFSNFLAYDTYFHLFFINYFREYRNNKSKNKFLIENTRFINRSYLNYAYLLHWLLSFLSPKHDNLIERYFNPILDAIFTGFLYLFFLYLSDSAVKAFLGALLYVFTPIFFITQSTGPRITLFTPRLFGEVVGILALMSFYIYLQESSYVFLLISLALSAAAFMSSKFTVQALLFISICAALLSLDIQYLFIPLGGVILAVVLSSGKYLEIFKFHFLHMKWYFINNLKGKVAVSARNKCGALLKSIVKFDLKEIYNQFFYKNSFLIVLIKYPIYFVSVYLILFDRTVNINFNDPSLVYLTAGTIVFFVTSTKYFLSFGEAERYLLYIVVFVITIILNSTMLTYVACFTVMYGLLFQLFDFLYIARQKKGFLDQTQIIHWLNKKQNPLRIATIPYHVAGGWRILYDTPHQWLYALFWMDDQQRQEMDEYFKQYPALDFNKINEVIEKYGLDIVIIKKEILDKFPSVEISIKYRKIDIFDDVMIFERQESEFLPKDNV